MTEHLNIFVGLTDEAQNAEIMIEKEEDQKKSIRNVYRRIRLICTFI